MNAWILLVIASSGQGVCMEKIEFIDEESCRRAGEKIVSDIPRGFDSFGRDERLTISYSVIDRGAVHRKEYKVTNL